MLTLSLATVAADVVTRVLDAVVVVAFCASSGVVGSAIEDDLATVTGVDEHDPRRTTASSSLLRQDPRDLCLAEVKNSEMRLVLTEDAPFRKFPVSDFFKAPKMVFMFVPRLRFEKIGCVGHASSRRCLFDGQTQN